MNRAPSLALLFAALLALGCGCERQRALPTPGDEVPCTHCERIVVMAPSTAEILGALGLLDRVVAVGDFVRWPPAVRALPKVGAYEAPSIEQVLAVGADLLLTTSSQAGGGARERLRRVGVRVVELDGDTFAGVFESIETLGRLLGRQERAAALTRKIRGEVEAVGRRVAGAPRRRVLFLVDRDPFFAAAPGSSVSKLIEIAGGVNIVAGPGRPYRMVSLEALLERRPEVIIDTSSNGVGAPRGRRLGPWGRWEFLPAVRQRRVYLVEPVRLVIPGPRLAEMARRMGRLIHPEIFGEPTEQELGPFSEEELGREGAHDQNP